ncbi:MAG: tetratricopeptide repeat protein [Acidobacteriota bacterium]
MGGWRIRLVVVMVLALAPLSVAAQSRPASTSIEGRADSKSPATVLIRQAAQLLRKGSPEQARQKVEEGLKLDPHSAPGYNLLGLVYEAENKYALSIEAFQKALKIAPHSTQILNNLGNSYLLQRKLSEAENEFRESLRLDPANRDANYNLGVVLLAEHHPKQAIPCFQRVHPADSTSLFNLVQAYLQAGETQQGLETARRLSNLNKNDVRLHFTLGVLLASNKQYVAGERELELADALQPNTFAILYNLGQAYLNSGDLTEADQVLNRALNLQPDSAAALYMLARVKADDRKALQALELLVKAHKLAPRNVDVIFLMARLSMKQSYYEDSIPLLQEGLKISPRSPDLHAALGECYFIAGKIDKAIQEFQTLIKLDPRARSYAFMALCYRHLGRYDEAKKYLEMGLKDDPKNAACLYSMGYIASRQGHYLQAEKWLKQALEAKPDYNDALLELAGVLMHQKEFAQAIPLLRKCVKLDPRPAPVYYKLAMAERNLHQLAAADQDLKVFQTLSKNPQPGPYPYQHLFDYLDGRAGLRPQQQTQFDVEQLQKEVKLHPDRPDYLYMLAQDYLKLGRTDDAKKVIAQLGQVSQGDFRTEVGVGVLLARYHLYADAIIHFKQALKSVPDSDDAWYDLADAYFRARDYPAALQAMKHVSPAAQKQTSFAFLLGDIYAHLGQSQPAISLFRQVIAENPDMARAYLSLALTYLRSGDLDGARAALDQGLSRVPNSGGLFWGMGILSAVQGKPQQAEQFLKKSVDLLPEWPAGYSALGVLYYETGQIDKARETLKMFTQNGPRGALDVHRIEQALSAAQSQNLSKQPTDNLPVQARGQILQVALALADVGRYPIAAVCRGFHALDRAICILMPDTILLVGAFAF